MTLFRRALPLALITSCAALALSGCDTAQAESEASLISGQADSAPMVHSPLARQVSPDALPREANPGEPSVGNWTSFDFTFEELASDGVSHFYGRCTPAEILRDSGWSNVASKVAPKETDFAVSCSKA